MDFLKYGGKTEKPVFLMNDLFMTDLLNEKNVAQNNFYLRFNVINTKDEYFYIGQLTQYDEFYDVGKVVSRPQVRELSDGQLLFRTNVYLHNEQLKQTR